MTACLAFFLSFFCSRAFLLRSRLLMRCLCFPQRGFESENMIYERLVKST
jgi:hypothetical protein